MRPRVLIVDDDKLMRQILGAILAANGFSVVGEAGSGQAAVEFCKRGAMDIICLDIHMPGLSGLDTLKALRKDYPLPKVVMVTGDAHLETVQDAVSLGACGYIIKPFSEAKVVDTLKRISGWHETNAV